VKNECRTDNALTIDGDYGDHRMKLFRLKDRMNYIKDIPSIFDK
jgi:hypothetical protein